MGGTFDPVHFGHLRLAQEAAEILGLERVRWVPAGRPWHRAQPKAPAKHRLEMVRLAIRKNALFELDDAEIRRPRPAIPSKRSSGCEGSSAPRAPWCCSLAPTLSAA